VETTNIERYLESFGKQVVNRSKGNLQRAGKGGDLEKSIHFEVIPDPENNGSFVVQFYMSSYGQFVDKGVSGNKKNQSYKSYNDKTITSPFSYTTKGPPIDIISKWIKKKGIKGHGVAKGRSKNTGQYISGLAYLISASIKREGIKSLSFFQKPLGLGLKQFGQELLGKVKEDIVSTLRTEQIIQVK